MLKTFSLDYIVHYLLLVDVKSLLGGGSYNLSCSVGVPLISTGAVS